MCDEHMLQGFLLVGKLDRIGSWTEQTLVGIDLGGMLVSKLDDRIQSRLGSLMDEVG